MWDPSIAPIIWGILWSPSSSYLKTLKQAEFGNCRKVCCKWIFTNLQQFLTIFEIVLLATHIPLLKHITIFQFQAFVMTLQLHSQLKLVSFIHVFLPCKHWPNLSQRNLNVLWDIWILCLNIFSCKRTQ